MKKLLLALILPIIFPLLPASAVGDVVFASHEIVASYTVEITPALAAQHEVKVKAVLPAKGIVTLEVSRGQDTRTMESWVSIEECYDQENNPVDIQQIDNRTWQVDTSHGLSIEYRANVNISNPMEADTYLAYLSEKCGLLSARSILLAPGGNEKTTVKFVLPEGWAVIVDETWIPGSMGEYVVNTSNFDALVAPGEWEIFQDTFGDGQKLTLAIMGETRYEKSQYIMAMKTCLDYFHQNIGKLPQKEMNVVMGPLPLPVDYMSTSPRLAVSRGIQSDWGLFEGMFWHYWFLRPVGFEEQYDADRAWWFGEGVSPFFLYPVYEKLEASKDVAQAWGFSLPELTWKNWYLVYEQYKGGKYDIPLVEYQAKSRETGDRNYYFPLPYMKSSLVLELLNTAMSEATNNTRDINDLTRYIYDNYIMKSIGFKVEDILQATNDITGVDFTTFFDAYIYGNQDIPVLVESNDYSFDLITLFSVLYPSLPNDDHIKPSNCATDTLELKKDSKHFSVYFHPQDEKPATLLLMAAERAYAPVARIFGGDLKLRVKMFMTYDPSEYVLFGGHGGQTYEAGVSAGGVAVDSGDEITWLNPVPHNETQAFPRTAMAHELGHIFMRQVYPGIYITSATDITDIRGLEYNQNWRSWFSEGLASYVDMQCWLEKSSIEGGPFLGAHDVFRQLVDSYQTGQPPVMGLSVLEEAGSGDEKAQLLFAAEGISFMYYVSGRYGDEGLHKLLDEYNKGVTIEVAAEKAFNISFTSLENDWRSLVEKTASNLNEDVSEITRIWKLGFDVTKAQLIKQQNEPFLALFIAYCEEQYGIPGTIPADTESPPQSTSLSPTQTAPSSQYQQTESPPQSTSLSPTQTAPSSQYQQPDNSFPWPLVVIPVIFIVLLSGIVMGITRLVKKVTKRK